MTTEQARAAVDDLIIALQDQAMLCGEEGCVRDPPCDDRQACLDALKDDLDKLIAAVEAEVQVWGIEEKLRAKYPSAEFDLVYGPDNSLHLKTYTDASGFWDPIDVVEDDLIDLQKRTGIALHVIPLRFEDREGRREDEPPSIYRNGSA